MHLRQSVVHILVAHAGELEVAAMRSGIGYGAWGGKVLGVRMQLDTTLHNWALNAKRVHLALICSGSMTI